MKRECPKCGGKNFSYDENLDECGETVYDRCQCEDCGTHISFIYTLTGVNGDDL